MSSTNQNWWLSSQGSPSGPHSITFIVAELKAGTISLQTHACPVGSHEWKRLADWPSFASACSFIPPPPPPSPSSRPFPPPVSRSPSKNTPVSATTDSLEDLAAAMTAHSPRGRSSAKSSMVPMRKQRKSSWPVVAAILGVGAVVIAIIGYGFIGGHVSLSAFNTYTPTSPPSASKNTEKTSPVAADTHVPNKQQNVAKTNTGIVTTNDTPEVWVVTKGGNVNNVNARISRDGDTLMHLAAKEGRVDVLAWLKKQGADVNAKIANGLVPMHGAAGGGHVAAMKWLKEQGVDVNARSINGITPMHAAAVMGHTEAMKWLKEQGADVNVKEENGMTPMHMAAGNGHIDAMRWLKEQGANVKVKDEAGWTPMHAAADGGHIEAMKWLKGQGADTNAKDLHGMTPMHFTAGKGHITAMKWLKEQDADVNAKNADGMTPMHFAAATGHIETMKWLRGQGADVNAKNVNGMAPMHFAAATGYIEAMKWLKEQGADINAKNKNGPTPFDVGTDEAKAWLRANGAK